MPLYTKESLERLRERIDLYDLLSSYVDFKKMGSSSKALCPFHEEKSPSFMAQKGDTHYHCFGCGAHGDAIAFLMQHLKFNFTQAVEFLAERYQVQLERTEKTKEEGFDRGQLFEVLEKAHHFYHGYLMESQEGKEALHYLQNRGITLEFVKKFELGFSPTAGGALKRALNTPEDVLVLCGLVTKESKNDFFRERIMFPIRNGMGRVIGFSARKIKESTFGGKYINSPETPLFKKSRVLFGLNYSRLKMAREKKALVVEGQIDCLKLIDHGLNITVAALGTAFGSDHVRELHHLGVQKVCLLFDGDEAGRAAASKVGDLLLKANIEVVVACLPAKEDPDSFINKKGIEALKALIYEGKDYLSFQIEQLGLQYDVNVPVQKSELIHVLEKQVKGWQDPILIHESLRKIAHLMGVPEQMLGVSGKPYTVYAKQGHLGQMQINSDEILEMDLLRWLILTGQEKPEVMKICLDNLGASHFSIPACREVFEAYKSGYENKEKVDMMTPLLVLGQQESIAFMEQIFQKKINRERAEKNVLETIQRLLDRKWLKEKDEIKKELEEKAHDPVLLQALLKKFNDLNTKRPQATRFL